MKKNVNILPDFEPYYHVGLGIYVRSRSHWRQIKREHQLEEIGTEDIRSSKNKGKSWNDIREEHGHRPLSKDEQREILNDYQQKLIRNYKGA
jgi:hypothetical protein